MTRRDAVIWTIGLIVVVAGGIGVNHAIEADRQLREHAENLAWCDDLEEQVRQRQLGLAVLYSDEVLRFVAGRCVEAGLFSPVPAGWVTAQ